MKTLIENTDVLSQVIFNSIVFQKLEHYLLKILSSVLILSLKMSIKEDMLIYLPSLSMKQKTPFLKSEDY